MASGPSWTMTGSMFGKGRAARGRARYSVNSISGRSGGADHAAALWQGQGRGQPLTEMSFVCGKQAFVVHRAVEDTQNLDPLILHTVEDQVVAMDAAPNVAARKPSSDCIAEWQFGKSNAAFAQFQNKAQRSGWIVLCDVIDNGFEVGFGCVRENDLHDTISLGRGAWI
ncbi:protein of unknown function [Aminobacter niigataensis]|nr:protein of unknown function [Aminobacter niigataensis]